MEFSLLAEIVLDMPVTCLTPFADLEEDFMDVASVCFDEEVASLAPTGKLLDILAKMLLTSPPFHSINNERAINLRPTQRSE